MSLSCTTPRVVRVKYCHESRGTRNQEWLCWRGPLAFYLTLVFLWKWRILHKDQSVNENILAYFPILKKNKRGLMRSLCCLCIPLNFFVFYTIRVVSFVVYAVRAVSKKSRRTSCFTWFTGLYCRGSKNRFFFLRFNHYILCAGCT
jgi:hypothetical protein